MGWDHEARESLTGHYAGCAIRDVKHSERSAAGFIVTLDCGHSSYRGHSIGKKEPCLESPCYRPVGAPQ